MPNSDIFDRKEGYGHTAGTVAAGKDNLTNGTKAQWQADSLTVPAQADEALAPRLARLVATPNATSRQYISPDLDAAGAWDGTNTTTGSNTALTNASTEANTNRTIDAMDATERAAIGFADRTSGWGHTSGTVADLND